VSQFSPEFERDIITAFYRCPSVFADYQDVIEPSLFRIPAYRKLWFVLREFYQETRELPTQTTLIQLIAEKTDVGFFLDEDMNYLLSNFDLIMNGTQVNERFVIGKMLGWVKDRRLRKKISEAMQLVEKGEADVDDILSLVRSAEAPVETSKQDEKDNFTGNIMDHLIRRKATADDLYIPTGISLLDEVTGGGPKRGYKCIFAGPPGHGKTTAAINVAAHAKQMGLGAYYLFNDDTEEELYDRLLSKLTYIPITELIHEDNFEEIQALQRKLQNSPGNIGIRQLELYSTPAKIRRLVERRIEAGYPVDVLIVDHLRNMRAEKTTEQSWYDLGSIYIELAQLAIEFNLVLYGVMHTSRQAETKSYLSNRDIGLSYEPVKDANLIVMIWRTKEDYKAQSGEDALRMQITKHRGGPGQGALMRFDADFRTMNFSTVGDLLIDSDPDMEDD
jgi:replicative DNA helicase